MIKEDSTEMSSVQPDGVAAAATEDRGVYHDGGKTGFLLIHGLSGTPVELRYIANGLARAGHTVYCPQLAGHCGTLEAAHQHDLARLVRQRRDRAEAPLGALRPGVRRRTVDGCHPGAAPGRPASRTPSRARCSMRRRSGSMAGACPGTAACSASCCRRVVANLIWFSERSPYGIKDQRLRAIIAEAIHSGDPSKAGFLSIPGGPMFELRKLVKTVKADLASITQPALILHPRAGRSRQPAQCALPRVEPRRARRNGGAGGQLSRHHPRPAARRGAGEDHQLCRGRRRSSPQGSSGAARPIAAA